MSASPSQIWCSGQGRFTDKGGFTLVEVLVAFTVMATLLTVLFRGVVTMRSGSLAFDDNTQQQIVARAVLEDALAKRDLAAGRYSGVRSGRRWTLIAKGLDLSSQMPPPDPDDAGNQAPSPSQNNPAPVAAKAATPRWDLQRLIVQLETKGRPFELETIRLVRAEQRR